MTCWKNRIKRTVLIGAALAVCGVVPTSVRANPEIYEATVNKTVLVISPTQKSVSLGTGVVVNIENRLVLTASHVVEKREKALICFPRKDNDGELISDPQYYKKNLNQLAIEGKVIATDYSHDLALIQLATLPSGTEAVSLAEHKIRIGEDLHMIGNSGCKANEPLWRNAHGEVRSVYDRTWICEGKRYHSWVIECQIPINHGDSGGPVLNDAGELVGIVHGRNEEEVLVEYLIEVRAIRAFLEETLGSLGEDTEAAVKPKAPARSDH
jgi:S1-C subfamily serine protease